MVMGRNLARRCFQGGAALGLLGMGAIAMAAIPPSTMLPITMPSSTMPPPVLVAQESRYQRVNFEPGTSSATIKDSVLRGTRDVYILGAQRQQVMTVRLVSLENNATFAVLAPLNRAGKRVLLRQDVMTWTGTLPESGDYRIVVGATRGNASYRLVIAIK